MIKDWLASSWGLILKYTVYLNRITCLLGTAVQSNAISNNNPAVNTTFVKLVMFIFAVNVLKLWIQLWCKFSL